MAAESSAAVERLRAEVVALDKAVAETSAELEVAKAVEREAEKISADRSYEYNGTDERISDALRSGGVLRPPGLRLPSDSLVRDGLSLAGLPRGAELWPARLAPAELQRALTGEWVAYGLVPKDGEVCKVTECFTLEVDLLGRISGGGQDSDGETVESTPRTAALDDLNVFQISDGRASSIGHISFDQRYEDGTVTRWAGKLSRISHEQQQKGELVLSGEWRDACEGTFVARRS